MTCIKLWVLLLVMLSNFESFASEIRNGGDVLLIAGAAKTLDEIEFAGAFTPQDFPESWTIIETQLNALRLRLPHGADFLKSLFYRGRLTWNFVDAKLKEVNDEGPMNVIVTAEKIQIAVNSGSLVQIYKEVWDKLNAQSRAVVLLHEALWVANGRQSLKTGESVRRLIAILTDKNLANYSTNNLIDSLRLCFEGLPQASAFFQILSLEHSQRANYQIFDPATVYTLTGDDVIVTPKDPRVFNTALTILNPNPKYERIQYKAGLYVGYQGTVDVSLNDLNTDLCSRIDYAEKQDWRLPLATELYRLNNLGFRLTRYFPPTRYPYTHDVELSATSFVDRFLKTATVGGQELFPSTFAGKDVVVVTSEGRHLNFNDRLHEISKSRDTELYYFCVHD